MTRKECVDGMQRIIDENRNKILVRVHVGYLIHAVKYLKEQPEIVRCKDCKHYRKDTCSAEAGMAVPPPDDWFCADGESRESGNE